MGMKRSLCHRVSKMDSGPAVKIAKSFLISVQSVRLASRLAGQDIRAYLYGTEEWKDRFRTGVFQSGAGDQEPGVTQLAGFRSTRSAEHELRQNTQTHRHQT